MKKLILAIAIMVSLVSFGQGKEGKGKFKTEQEVEAQLKQMTTDLNLSDKQQGEVKLIMMDLFNKRQQMREEMKKDKESGVKISDEKKAEMKKHRIDEQLEMKTKIKKILSEEQMKKLGELRKTRTKEMNEKESNEEGLLEKKVK